LQFAIRTWGAWEWAAKQGASQRSEHGKHPVTPQAKAKV
jgi:hypothetical protein